MKRLVAWLSVLLSGLLTLAQAESPPLRNQFAHLDGVKIHYESVGTGSKALVFIHGWTCSAMVWRQSIREFPEYHVIALDLPGHGQSDKPRVDYTMDYFARGIEAVMRDAGVREAVLVGHSMGTPVVRQFYRLYPGQTLGLVIVDGALHQVAAEMMDSVIASLRADYSAEDKELVDGMLEPIRHEKLKLKIRSVMLATPDYVGLSAAEAALDKTIWMEDKIHVPVLAILAASSRWPPGTESFYRSIVPDLEFQMWPGVSHFLMMEQTAAFNKAIKRFVSRNKLL